MQGYYMTLYADISYYMTHKNNKTDMMMLMYVKTRLILIVWSNKEVLSTMRPEPNQK